jgi:hypothetical protein
MKYYEKLYEKIKKDKEELSESYDVPISAIVYIGNNKYIVCKNGEEIYI